MDTNKKILIRFLITCLICMGSASAPLLADESADVAKLIDSADSLRKEAAAVGHEWRYTGKWIKDARAALKSGDIATAKQLAEKAEFEATRALEQSKISKTTWIIAVPK